MKIQDLVFIVILVFLLVLRKPRLFVVTGLGSLLLSIPLFSFWIFFTAQRLVWYAAAYFFVFIIFSLLSSRKVQ